MAQLAPFPCPSCGLLLPLGPGNPAGCPRCALPLVGPVAAALGHVDAELRLLDAELAVLRQRGTALVTDRHRLLAELRATATDGPPSHATHGVATQLPLKTTLLGLGALLLSVAAVIFTVLAWGRLGLGGRAVVLGVGTLVAAASAGRLHRRGLTATADAVAASTLVLVTLDLHAGHLLGWVPGGGVGSRALDAAVLALCGGVTGVRFRLPVTTTLAVIAGQVVAPLGVVALAGPGTDVHLTVSGMAVATAATAVVDLALRGRLGAAAWGGAARTTLLVGGGTGLVLATVTAVGTGLVAASSAEAPSGTATLAAVAAAWVAASLLVAARWAALPAAGAAVSVLAATSVPVVAGMAVHGASPVLLVPAGVGVLLTGSARLLPRHVRLGPLLVGVTATALAATPLIGETVVALLAPVAGLAHPWVPPRPHDTVTVLHAAGLRFDLIPLDVLRVGLVAAVFALAGPRTRRVGTALTTGALLLVPAAVPVGLPLAVALTLLLITATTLATLLGTLPERWLPYTIPLAVTALGWSGAAPSLTLVTLAVLATLAGLLATEGRPRRTAACTTSCSAVATGLGLSLAPVAALAAGTARATAGVVLAAAGTVVLLAGDRFPCGPRQLHSSGLRTTLAVAALATVTGVVLTAHRPTWLALLLTGLGVAALATAARPDRRAAAVLGGGLCTAAGWVRLIDVGVTVPEAYTLPAAVLAVLTGVAVLRRRPELGATLLLTPGLSLALGPSLFATLAGSGTTRPLLLTAGAAGVVVASCFWRLRAPLALGVAALAVVTVRQLAPLAAVTPRWMLLAGLGLAFLVLGARYEGARDGVGRWRRSFARLG